jgi:FkbM family methyltransferase
VWGAIYELAEDEEHGIPREGQLTSITTVDELLANDPWITLQIGHFVKTDIALATPFDTRLDCGEDVDYYLRMWSKYRCLKIAQPFFYNRRGRRATGPRAATDRDWRIAIQRIIRAKCESSGFHADFTHRGECFRFYVFNPFDPRQRSFLKGGFFEQEQLSFLDAWLGQGAHVVDIGAHAGNHAVYFARFLRPRSLTLFEPDPQVFDLLRRNLAANDVHDADLSRLGIAVAASESRYELQRSAAAHDAIARLAPAPSGEVRGAPLDNLIDSQVDFIRIDARGMELDILAGAARVLAAWRPKIMISVGTDRLAAFRQWLERSAYRVARESGRDEVRIFMLEPKA